MKVYSAGKITGNPDYYEQFAEAEKLLTEQGHAVINPVKADGFTYREYINMGLCQLFCCDAIYLLEGWKDSPGARLEHTYAKTVGLEIFYDEEDKEDDTVRIAPGWDRDDFYRIRSGNSV